MYTILSDFICIELLLWGNNTFSHRGVHICTGPVAGYLYPSEKSVQKLVSSIKARARSVRVRVCVCGPNNITNLLLRALGVCVWRNNAHHRGGTMGNNGSHCVVVSDSILPTSCSLHIKLEYRPSSPRPTPLLFHHPT